MQPLVTLSQGQTRILTTKSSRKLTPKLTRKKIINQLLII